MNGIRLIAVGVALLAMLVALSTAFMASEPPTPTPQATAAASAVSTTGQLPPGAMRLVVLGTGTPNDDPDRSGPATAIVIGDMAYLVDAGPGVVRRAASARQLHEAPGLAPSQLGKVFITHLHSDHTLGLPDVMLGNWVLDRMFPIDVFGPPGTRELTDGIEAAWAIDLDIRMNGPEPHDEPHYRAVTTEIEPGEIYRDEHVVVEAIPVPHANWPHAFGYKFTGGGRTILISGDTKPAESLVEACDGCDVLVHEVYSAEAWERRTPDWQSYHADAHTSTIELADIARRARPGLLVLYHQLYWGATDEDLIREIRAAGYEGDVVSARDLDIY